MTAGPWGYQEKCWCWWGDLTVSKGKGGGLQPWQREYEWVQTLCVFACS